MSTPALGILPPFLREATFQTTAKVGTASGVPASATFTFIAAGTAGTEYAVTIIIIALATAEKNAAEGIAIAAMSEPATATAAVEFTGTGAEFKVLTVVITFTAAFKQAAAE